MYVVPTVNNMHVRFAIHEFISGAMGETVCTMRSYEDDTYEFFFSCAKKIEKWREMPTRIFVPGYDW
jgi:hypothetical protein